MYCAASKLAICRIQMFPLFTPAAFLFPPIELIEVYKFRSTPNSVSFDFGSHRCHVERIIKKKRLVLFFSLISPPFLPSKSFPSKMLSNSRSLFVVKMNLPKYQFWGINISEGQIGYTQRTASRITSEKLSEQILFLKTATAIYKKFKIIIDFCWF